MSALRRLQHFGWVLVVVALVAAGCGGDDDDSDKGGSSKGTNQADSSLSTIRLGVQGEFSGFSASSNAGSPDISKAWQKWVNKTQGGINGHPVSVHVVDDAGDSAKGLAAFKGFVDEGVIAMVSGGSTQTITAINSNAVENSVPIIAGDNYLPTAVSSPMIFPFTITVPEQIGSVWKLAKDKGFKKVGVFACAESPACDTDSIERQLSVQFGVPYGGLQKVAFDAPNYTAQCLAMKNAGVDFIWLATSAQGAIKMMGDCLKQGYDPTFSIGFTTWDKNIRAFSSAKILGAINSVPFFSKDPRADGMYEAWNDFGPGGDIPTQQAAITFQGLELFRKVASTIDSDNPTAADMVAALGKVADEDLGGLLPKKLAWTPGQKAAPGNGCYFTIGNNKGTLSEDLTPQCVPPLKIG